MSGALWIGLFVLGFFAGFVIAAAINMFFFGGPR